jgi:phospholipase/carboxylesterase
MVMKIRNLGGLDVRVTGGADGEGGGDGPVVVLLHGFGAPGDDLVPLWRALAAPRGTRFVFPEGPLDLGESDSPSGAHARAWWPIDIEALMMRRARGELRDVNVVPEGLEAAREKIVRLLTDVETTLAPPPSKVVLGGFSQGAMLTLDVALRTTRPFAGLVLMSGTHIAAKAWEPLFDARRGLPVFMSHGESDELLPFSTSEALRDTLAAHGLPVRWVSFRGGHGIAPNVAAGVGEFLARVLV